MRIAIMQPYFLPYLGYLALIKHSDYFIVFDTPQFIRHGWIERNRILKPKDGWQYIKVPLEKHSRDTAIKDIKIKNENNWKTRILAQLDHYKKKANYYTETVNLVKRIIDLQTDSITKLNSHALENICRYLDIDFSYEIFSEMDLNIEKPNEPDEWALKISKAFNAKEYINPPGGESFFDSRKYEKENINLHFLKLNLQEYDQRRSSFIPGLSIIDIMMFNSPKQINEMLNDYELE